MSADLTTTLVGLLIGNDKELPARLQKQSKQLQKVKCTDETYGIWLKDLELPVLLEILTSPDSYFHTRFPGLESFDKRKRKALAKEIQDHVSTCRRCTQKVSDDLAWSKKVDSVISQNRGLLKQLFQIEETSLDEPHHGCGRHLGLV